MTKDLTNSQVDRRNVLNNKLAISEAYEQIAFRGVMFENKYRFTKRQIARYYEVDERTIERLLESHGKELTDSGYELFTGTRLRALKNALLESKRAGHADVSDIDVGDIVEIIEDEDFSLMFSNSNCQGIVDSSVN